jgi:hypothetical protein
MDQPSELERRQHLSSLDGTAPPIVGHRHELGWFEHALVSSTPTQAHQDTRRLFPERSCAGVTLAQGHPTLFIASADVPWTDRPSLTSRHILRGGYMTLGATRLHGF